MGDTPQQVTPSDAGVDCGFFTLSFAMEISLGRNYFDFGQDNIPAIRNWMTHTIIHHGKQNDTYDLEHTPTRPSGIQQEGRQLPLNQNKRRITGEDGSSKKTSK